MESPGTGFWKLRLLLLFFLYSPFRVVQGEWCQELEREVQRLKWAVPVCSSVAWKPGGTSIQGRSLMYAEFGMESSSPNVTSSTTLIFSMVHGDEVTPLFLALQLAHVLQTQSQGESPWLRLGHRVVLAPLINPDGFFHQPRRLRVNARGVDLNRNFKTADWLQGFDQWKKRGSPPRRFPGNAPVSEPETLFQIELINRLKPKIILSIHSPLDYLDMVGPSHPIGSNHLANFSFSETTSQHYEKLRQHLKAMVGDFFPGSLGNYAGRVLGIPTLTLELPSSDASRAAAYWKRYQNGIQAMIHYPLAIEALDSSDWGRSSSLVQK